MSDKSGDVGISRMSIGAKSVDNSVQAAIRGVARLLEFQCTVSRNITEPAADLLVPTRARESDQACPATYAGAQLSIPCRRV